MDRLKRALVAFAAAWHIHVGASGLDGRHPLDIPVRDYALMLAVSLLGGFVGWFGRFKRGHVRTAGLIYLVGEGVTSVLSGLLAFWGCWLFSAPQLVTICLVALSGHMGAKFIAFLDRWVEKRARRFLADSAPGDL